MKKTLLLVVIMTLLVGSVLLSTTVFASDINIESEESLAQKSAQEWLDATAPQIPGLPQWSGAHVVLQRSYNDLNGEVNSYLFAITDRTRVVGWVMIGNSSYDYTMFEASEVMPPTAPTTDEIMSAIQKIGLNVADKEIGQPVDFVYTGIGGFYAIYDIGEQTIAINLIRKTALPATDLKYALSSPEDYRNAKKTLRESAPQTRGGYKVLELSYYQPGGGACGPCAGVSIGQYYRDEQGYDDLYNNSDMYTVLYTLMQVSPFGWVWPPENFGNGFEVMTESCDYDDFDYTTDTWVSSNDYWVAVDYIDNDWPIGLCIYYDHWHWRAIRGYGYVTEMDIYMVYCTDSAALSDYYIINWTNWCLNAALSKIHD